MICHPERRPRSCPNKASSRRDLGWGDRSCSAGRGVLQCLLFILVAPLRSGGSPTTRRGWLQSFQGRIHGVYPEQRYGFLAPGRNVCRVQEILHFVQNDIERRVQGDRWELRVTDGVGKGEGTNKALAQKARALFDIRLGYASIMAPSPSPPADVSPSSLGAAAGLLRFQRPTSLREVSFSHMAPGAELKNSLLSPQTLQRP